MSELEGIERVNPGDRSRDRPRKRPPERDFEEDVEAGDETDEPAETEDEGLPASVLAKRKEGREIGPPGNEEEGQIIDILA